MADPYPRWRLFPAWRQAGPWVEEIVDAFRSVRAEIDSATHKKSNEVLAGLRPALLDLGFIVEGPDRVPRPVLFGDEGQVVKSFNVDAYREDDGVALELEAGGAVYNNRILLDLMKMALAVDVTYGVIAVPLKYETTKKWTPPYPETIKLFEAIFSNPERLRTAPRQPPHPRLLSHRVRPPCYRRGMPSQRSLGPILDEARAERVAQLQHQGALDTKAGILLGFAGALVVLSPTDGSILLDAGRAGGVAAAMVALSVFWPRSFPAFDLRELRDLYLSADPAFTLRRILDSQISMIDTARVGLERKATRLKVAMASLAAGSLLTALGLAVRW